MRPSAQKTDSAGVGAARPRGALRADFQRYYGLDIDGARGLGASAVADLAQHLPRESALRREIDPSFGWGEECYLLALIEYELRVLIWSLSDPKKRGAHPKPMETPADAAKRSRLSKPPTRAEMDRVADRLGIPKERR